MTLIAPSAPAEDVELRCPSHLHGVALDTPGGYVLSIKCHQCSKRLGRPVFHRWDVRTWVCLDPPDVALNGTARRA